jgi:restriction endonuclease S subunit
MPVLLPPQDQQIEIVNELKTYQGKIQSILSKTESAITLLQERRKAVIAAAVSGQLEMKANK